MKYNNSYTVSVVITTFNHERYIEKCLNSILLQQTDFIFNIIIAEDNSNDETLTLCAKFQKKLPDRIQILTADPQRKIFIEGKGTGRYNFINGLTNADAEYIALCDGDDYWEDTFKLQKQVDFLNENRSYAGCYHDTRVFNSLEGNSVKLFRDKMPEKITAEDTISSIAPFHISSFMFRSNTLVVDFLRNKIKSGDMMLFSIIAKYGDIGRVHDTYSVYRLHESGITKSEFIISSYHMDRINLIKKLNEFHNFKYDKKAKKVINFHKRQIYLLKYQNTWMEKIVSKFLTLRYPI